MHGGSVMSWTGTAKALILPDNSYTSAEDKSTFTKVIIPYAGDA